MICPSCGAQNHADFSFCLQCGHPLGQADQNGEQFGATRADIVPVEAGTMAMPGASTMSGIPPTSALIDTPSTSGSFANSRISRGLSLAVTALIRR